MALASRRAARRELAPTGARAAVLAALGAVEHGAAPADALAPLTAALEPRDQGFAHLLLLTVLRRRGQIDALLATCLAHSLPRGAARIRDLLRLGVAQILFLDTPPHAAVDTAVDLAGRESGRFAPLVNAVLRRVVRERAALTVFVSDPAANLPRWLWQSWVEAWGEATARAIAAVQVQEAPLDLSLKDPATADHWRAALGATALPGGTLRLRPAGRIDALPGFADGAWWVQDLAAALPAQLLLDGLAQAGRGRGARVIDLCAAPGGKTAQLAAEGAHVTAVDRAAPRLARTAANLARVHLAADCVVADVGAWRPAAP
ncbi:MAG: MFS transporter, partial [Alphaproteobacteria bacterium]|nr:MFS transporter [Alphaproteobacteria bacterium]